MQIKHLAQLQHCMNTGKAYNLPTTIQPNYYSVTLALLNLARNCHVQKYSHLNVLQQITRIITNLVRFDSPVDCLASFDRQKFRQVIKQNMKNNKSDEILYDMVVGIYPLKKITEQVQKSLIFRIDLNSVEGEVIGNKNWKLTRKVIEHYYKSASQRHKLCLQVLMGLPELRDNKYENIQWRNLWTQIYLMCNSILINPDAKNFQLIQKGQNFIEKLKEAIDFTTKSSNETYQQVKFRRIILKLIGFIIKKFVFGKEQNDLNEFNQFFRTIKQDNFPLLTDYLMSLVLAKTILQNCNMIEESNYYKNKLNDFIKQKTLIDIKDPNSLKSQKEVILLKSYLVSYKELPSFLYQNGLNFWEYQIDQNQSQILAEKYLLNYQRLPENFEWSKVFSQLSSSALEHYILKAGKSWLKNKWAQQFISTTSKQNKISIDKFSARKNEHVKQILSQFAEQWNNFNIIEKYGLKRSIHEVESILTYNFEFSEDLHKMFIFPQDDQEVFVQILMNYIKFVKQEKLLDEKYQLFFSSQLANNLLRIDNDLLDNYWAEWADFLINKDPTLQALLKIEIKQNQLLQKSWLQEKTSVSNGHLYLRSE